MDWTVLGKAVLDFVYPPKCCLCETIGTDDVCAECQAECEPDPRPPASLTGPYTLVDAAYAYDGRPAQAVRRLKYDRATGLWRWMGAKLLERYDQSGLDSLFDMVVPVPLARGRLSQRGFNQSELLAASMPNVRTDALVRLRETPHQVGLKAEARRANLMGAFLANGVQGQRVLLLDDVYTTGATAEACAVALRNAGATEVGMLAFCRVNDPVPEPD